MPLRTAMTILLLAAAAAFAQGEQTVPPEPGTENAPQVTEQTAVNETGQGTAETSGAATTTTTTEQPPPEACMGGGGIMSFLPMIAIIAIFYFLMIRPQQKQAKRLREMREAFQVNDRVITGGGIHGVITNIKGNVVTVRIADGVKIDVDRDSLHLEGAQGETSAKGS